jgi:predicted ferric reductase
MGTQRLSVNLGSFAFIAMTLIIVVTIFKLLPYHLWKKLHQWMSVVFLVSFLHFQFSEKAIGSDLSNSLLYLAALLGLGSAAYKQIFYGLFIKPFQYTVAKTEALNETLLKVTLIAKGKHVPCMPGQYGFIHFQRPNFSNEQHPFTLAWNVKNKNLLIYVKCRGDYTNTLYRSLAPGWAAFIDGPYGRLDYRPYKKQIWIAGGIGIALFISWIHSLKPSHGKTIDLFFCCHNRSDLAILKELEVDELGIQIFTFCSENNNRFSCDELIKKCPDFKERKIFMCGPQRLTKAMKKQLLTLSVNKNNIEHEDFNFFN